MEQMYIINREDLTALMGDMFAQRYEGRLVDSRTAAQLLGITVSTLDRWIERRLVHTENEETEKREVRKFDMAYILGLDIQEIKKKYRALSK